MLENPWNQILEVHFGEFPETSDFQCLKTICKTEACSCSGCLTLAILWTEEVEVTKSVDDPVTSQSLEGHEFLNVEMLDANIAPSLERIITNQNF